MMKCRRDKGGEKGGNREEGYLFNRLFAIAYLTRELVCLVPLYHLIHSTRVAEAFQQYIFHHNTMNPCFYFSMF